MASIMKRGDSYSVRYKYKDHSGKPCEGWESFKTRKEAQERKITVEKELLDGTFLVPDTMTVEEMLYKWIPIQSTKHNGPPRPTPSPWRWCRTLSYRISGSGRCRSCAPMTLRSSMPPLPRPPAGSCSGSRMVCPSRRSC